jgi:NAD(P)-dependent dehydrogenase (short-subunit alcohol dehydrogenase family)
MQSARCWIVILLRNAFPPIVYLKKENRGFSMSKAWLITGSGNGLGRDIAEAVLAAGDSIVAGARRTEELAPLVAQYGERVKPVSLDVRDEAAAKAAVELAVESFGRLDVLVNNAGYGQFVPFEQMSEKDFQAIVDTCFYGVVYTTRAAVPVMRQQKSGPHLSNVFGRWSPRRSGQYGVSRGQVGGGRFQRLACDGSRALRSQGLHTRAGRYSDQLGTARRSECAGLATGI